ncbi:EF-hand domain-containing protein [Streptomyces ochraceiscleroticus]|uniref:EF-hand domain-containing protein n=1 Tax=Streptomyces ochraceiscleroticus TaxID=47761 RepID=A0ABW1MUI4_9ACTN|nr:EF-hand domain-containing protein [Streptomyces ochraceiscleroticus]
MQTRIGAIAMALTGAAVLGASGSAFANAPASTPPTFQQIDTDRSGTVSEPELHVAGKQQGVSESNIRKAFHLVDRDSNGQISKEEFSQASRTQ